MNFKICDYEIIPFLIKELEQDVMMPCFTSRKFIKLSTLLRQSCGLGKSYFKNQHLSPSVDFLQYKKIIQLASKEKAIEFDQIRVTISKTRKYTNWECFITDL